MTFKFPNYDDFIARQICFCGGEGGDESGEGDFNFGGWTGSMGEVGGDYGEDGAAGSLAGTGGDSLMSGIGEPVGPNAPAPDWSFFELNDEDEGRTQEEKNQALRTSMLEEAEKAEHARWVESKGQFGKRSGAPWTEGARTDIDHNIAAAIASRGKSSLSTFNDAAIGDELEELGINVEATPDGLVAALAGQDRGLFSFNPYAQDELQENDVVTNVVNSLTGITPSLGNMFNQGALDELNALDAKGLDTWGLGLRGGDSINSAYGLSKGEYQGTGPKGIGGALDMYMNGEIGQPDSWIQGLITLGQLAMPGAVGLTGINYLGNAARDAWNVDNPNDPRSIAAPDRSYDQARAAMAAQAAEDAPVEGTMNSLTHSFDALQDGLGYMATGIGNLATGMYDDTADFFNNLGDQIDSVNSDVEENDYGLIGYLLGTGGPEASETDEYGNPTNRRHGGLIKRAEGGGLSTLSNNMDNINRGQVIDYTRTNPMEKQLVNLDKPMYNNTLQSHYLSGY